MRKLLALLSLLLACNGSTTEPMPPAAGHLAHRVYACPAPTAYPENCTEEHNSDTVLAGHKYIVQDEFIGADAYFLSLEWDLDAGPCGQVNESTGRCVAYLALDGTLGHDTVGVEITFGAVGPYYYSIAARRDGTFVANLEYEFIAVADSTAGSGKPRISLTSGVTDSASGF